MVESGYKESVTVTCVDAFLIKLSARDASLLTPAARGMLPGSRS